MSENVMSLSENLKFLSACIQASNGMSWIQKYILGSNVQAIAQARAQVTRRCPPVMREGV